MPSIKAENNGFMTSSGTISSASADSNANLFLVPEIGIVDRINNKLVFGIGAFGVSGIGYRLQWQSFTAIFRVDC